MSSEETVTMYRPVGPAELELLQKNGFAEWPPRLPVQPIFYPVANEEYAAEISKKWNVPAYGVGYVTRFYVKKSFMDRYSVQRVGWNGHDEWWIPKEDLAELNENLVGKIELIGEYH